MMSTYSTKQIRTDHKDLIQDIAFDFYGKRVATASLDQSVKIWNINEKGDWIFKEELKVFNLFLFVTTSLFSRTLFKITRLILDKSWPLQSSLGSSRIR